MKNVKLMRQNNRSLRCPVCPVQPAGRIIDLADTMDVTRVMLYSPQDSRKAQLLLKCPKCRSTIGISIAV